VSLDAKIIENFRLFSLLILCVASLINTLGSPTLPLAPLQHHCNGRAVLKVKYCFQTEYFGVYATMLALGMTAIVAAAITMTLPESKNIKLPDTIDEAKGIGSDVKRKNIGNNSP